MTVTDGIEAWMVFEALGGQRDTTVNALEDHVGKLETMDSVEITEKTFDDVEEVEDPHPALDTGFSQVCEVRCRVTTFSKLIEIVLNYGPSMIEIEGPENIELDLNEARESLNLVAEMMQKFLQSGAGGMMISDPDEE
jgi:hypothetical protein